MLPAADLLNFLAPLLLLVLGAMACLIAEPFLTVSDKHKVLPWIASLSLVFAAGALHQTHPGHLYTMLALDPIRAGLWAVLLLVSLLGIASLQQSLSRDQFTGGEAYVLVLLATIGGTLMVLSANTISLFVGMELASLSIYPMVGMRRLSATSGEGLLKYFAMGAVFSAIFFYGAALVYGATGTTSLGGSILPGRENLFLFGSLLLTLSLLFKAGLFPFHFWAPDAYTGAPAAVTGFMAGTIKVGAFAGLGAIWLNGFLSFAGYPLLSPVELRSAIPPMLFSQLDPKIFDTVRIVGNLLFVALSLGSILVGSLSLLRQQSVRRFMAFSSVANAGFMGFALTLPSLVRGYVDLQSLWLYLAGYAIAASAALAALTSLATSEDDGDSLASLAGSGRERPFAASVLTLALISLAGLPPLVGFVAKFQVLSGLFLNFPQGWAITIPVGAFALAIVSTLAYARVAILVWSDAGPGRKVGSPETLLLKVALVVAGLSLVLLTAWPMGLWRP